MFAARRLSAPWALCPSTTDPDIVREWLTWGAVGMEGVVFKRLDGVYQPSVRGWRKYKVRETTEAVFPVKFLCSVHRARALTDETFVRAVPRQRVRRR
ncbi:hypothetical protein GCM10010313_83170 [Streptomyces violarus]|nr:hypothetical protein GCM10010313_83170 [Streptomyces violarus]